MGGLVVWKEETGVWSREKNRGTLVSRILVYNSCAHYLFITVACSTVGSCPVPHTKHWALEVPQTPKYGWHLVQRPFFSHRPQLFHRQENARGGMPLFSSRPGPNVLLTLSLCSLEFRPRLSLFASFLGSDFFCASLTGHYISLEVQVQASVHSAFLEKGEMESVGQINAKKLNLLKSGR